MDQERPAKWRAFFMGGVWYRFAPARAVILAHVHGRRGVISLGHTRLMVPFDLRKRVPEMVAEFSNGGIRLPHFNRGHAHCSRRF